jgi:beta-galactosidase/beta-glucuronidase
MRSTFATLWMLAVATASAGPTLTLPLSGTGADGEKPVYWDFQLDAGRGAGAWKKIAVPSCWEQQGFGTYYYGTQGRGKPDTDPAIPKETGIYRRTFDLPAAWKDRAVLIVFEGVMTDATVLVNGQSAGPTHQGGFYRFEYDLTSLVKPGRNQIEVRVSKESSNASVNHAERRGDYWTFGGIFRPVWLEARPADHVAWTAIDARADGSFLARVHLNRRPPAGARLRIQLLDAAGKPFGAPLVAAAGETDEIVVTGKLASPKTWTAETPHLYTAHISLLAGDRELHRLDRRIGFRTLEVRANDGVYLNGSKIVLKGINRHSFRPATGRTLTRAEN